MESDLRSRHNLGSNVTLVCPSCETMFTNTPVTGYGRWQVHACEKCHSLILTEYSTTGVELSGGRIAYPYKKPRVIEGIPEDVAFNYDQSLRSHSAGALNAAAVMARATIESICQNLQATGSDLKKKLENLRDTQKITPRLWAWADTIRLWGNESVHDFPRITQKEADYIIRFAWEVIEHVYVKEADFQRIRHPKST